MALLTVTLTWNVTDLIQAGIAATLTITPTARLDDSTDSIIIAGLPRQVAFTGGTGSLAGIVANDNSALAPGGTGYRITIDTQGTALVPGVNVLDMTTAISHSAGATQDLSDLLPLLSPATMVAYLPLAYAPGAAAGYAWTSQDGAGTGAWQLPSRRVVALTDAATIAVDASLGSDLRVTLGGNRTLGNPANPADGRQILVQVTQDATGSRSLAYGTAYEFSASLPAPALSTAPGATDLLTFIYNAAKGKWLLAAYLTGFA